MDTRARRPQGETRALVKQHYKKGMTIREIADRLGVSVQMVSNHVRNLIADGEVKGRR